MAKKELNLHAVVSPAETVVVSAYNENGNAEACTLAFYMVSSHIPPCVTIAINATQRRKTLAAMLDSKAFVLAFPSIDQILLIMTSNAPDTGYQGLLRNYQQTLSTFVGPTEVFVSGDTQQLKDYSKTDWPWYFNAEAKYRRHETVFPVECRKVYEMGETLFR